MEAMICIIDGSSNEFDVARSLGLQSGERWEAVVLGMRSMEMKVDMGIRECLRMGEYSSVHATNNARGNCDSEAAFVADRWTTRSLPRTKGCDHQALEGR
jgi:hypothetical protein